MKRWIPKQCRDCCCHHTFYQTSHPSTCFESFLLCQVKQRRRRMKAVLKHIRALANTSAETLSKIGQATDIREEKSKLTPFSFVEMLEHCNCSIDVLPACGLHIWVSDARCRHWNALKQSGASMCYFMFADNIHTHAHICTHACIHTRQT